MTETLPPRRSILRAVAWTIVLMLISFAGGVFVGLHPGWLPFSPPASMIGDSWAGSGPSDRQLEFNREMNQPTTEPATQPSHSMP